MNRIFCFLALATLMMTNIASSFQPVIAFISPSVRTSTALASSIPLEHEDWASSDAVAEESTQQQQKELSSVYLQPRHTQADDELRRAVVQTLTVAELQAGRLAGVAAIVLLAHELMTGGQSVLLSMLQQ